MTKYLPLFLMISGTAMAAQSTHCAPTPPATCYPAECNCYYCLGPVKYQGNTPVRPYTCNGDFTIQVAGLYWNAHQDGMEYAIDNAFAISEPFFVPDLQGINTLIDAKYKSPYFKWDFGFKIGLGYNTTCDGWDLGVLWTHYRGKAFSHDEALFEDNHALIALWSGFLGAVTTGFNFATDIQTHWNFDLDLVDVSLGREYWVSKYLTFRPYISLRGSWIPQHYIIQYKGGSWDSFFVAMMQLQPALNDKVDLENNFHGVGVRSGFDTVWNLGCGWGIYQNLAASIVYGRFEIEHDEWIQLAQTPFTKTRVLDTSEHFRVSRSMLDLELGVQWHSLFCDCQYGLTALLAWEQHLFFHQNQMWRVNRSLGDFGNFPNNTGENIFSQRRGTLSTQGWTLTLRFDF